MRHSSGMVEVITGSMFSGKTDELIRRLRRAKIARQNVQVFKPNIDDRYGVEKLASHAGSEFEATPIEAPRKIYELLAADTTVVAVDEAQFFDAAICDVVQALAERGVRVLVAGLDTDFRANRSVRSRASWRRQSGLTSCTPSAWCAGGQPPGHSA